MTHLICKSPPNMHLTIRSSRMTFQMIGLEYLVLSMSAIFCNLIWCEKHKTLLNKNKSCLKTCRQCCVFTQMMTCEDDDENMETKILAMLSYVTTDWPGRCGHLPVTIWKIYNNKNFFCKNNVNDLVQASSKLLMGFKNAKCIDVYQIKAMNKKCRKQNWSNQHHHHRQHQHHNHNRR